MAEVEQDNKRATRRFALRLPGFGYLHRGWGAGKKRADPGRKRPRHLLLCGLGDCRWLDH